MLDPRNTEYFPSISPKGIRKPALQPRETFPNSAKFLPLWRHVSFVIKSIDVTLANHVIFWPRETVTLLKSNLRCFHREKSTFEKFDAGLKLRIVFYTHMLLILYQLHTIPWTGLNVNIRWQGRCTTDILNLRQLIANYVHLKSKHQWLYVTL